VEQACGRIGGVQTDTTRQRVAVPRPDALPGDLVPLLLGALDHPSHGGLVHAGPGPTALGQRGDQLRQRRPSLVVELQLVQPRRVPEGVGDSAAEVDVGDAHRGKDADEDGRSCEPAPDLRARGSCVRTGRCPRGPGTARARPRGVPAGWRRQRAHLLHPLHDDLPRPPGPHRAPPSACGRRDAAPRVPHRGRDAGGPGGGGRRLRRALGRSRTASSRAGSPRRRSRWPPRRG
jgi:hypothetical protein